MNKLYRVIFVTALCLALASCGSGAASSQNASSDVAEYHQLTAEQAKARMDGSQSVIVLDVRTQEEYEEKHISNAILVPNETIGTERPQQLPDLDAEILVYCRSGNRSKQAAEKLVAMGYTKVYDFGGINSWPYDTVSGSEDAQAVSSGAAAGNGVLSTFTSTDIDGNDVDATVFQGKKLTMVNIWATFCGPCIREMPDLAELSGAYPATDFQIIGIPVDVTDRSGQISDSMVETAKTIIEKTGANYLHILPSASLIEAKLGAVSAVPETIFVDETGTQVGKSYLGSRSKEAWAKIIDGLLEEMA